MLLMLTIAPRRPCSIAHFANARAPLSGPIGVDGEKARRVGRLRVDQRPNGESGGIVDEDVDGAEAINSRRHHPLAVLRLGDVGCNRKHRRAAFLLDRGSRARKRLLGPPGDDDPRPLAGEGARDRVAEPGAAAGHDRDLAGELVHEGRIAHRRRHSAEGGRTRSRPPCGGGLGWGSCGPAPRSLRCAVSAQEVWREPSPARRRDCGTPPRW